MSDRVGLKAKDNAAKKFSSLNLNQTYKGTKVEPKAPTGIPRHGLQSLGKVAFSRRMPPPANLPSLKSENLGNDPTVALVPSGGGGWGSGKDKEASTTTTTATKKNATQGPATAGPPQAQQHSKPTDASQEPTTAQQTSTGQTVTTNQTSATTKTWANSSSSVAGGQERTSYPQQSQHFNREFPTLGGVQSKDKLPEEKASHQPYGQPPRNMHEPPWMDKGSGPPPKPSYGMYNGAPYPGPQQRSGYGPQMFHREGHTMNNHTQDFPYMGQSRPANYATHPAANQRGHPGSRIAGPVPPKPVIKLEDSPSGYVRPSVVNEEDIRAMDSEDVDDGGWAGAQEEIDYSVKLNFDDDELPSPVASGKPSDRERKPPGSADEMSQSQGEKVVNGDKNRTQVDGRLPPAPRPAWGGPPEGHNNYQPQWIDAPKQGQYNVQGQYNAQMQWASHFPQQHRSTCGMGPPPGSSNVSGRPLPQDQSRNGRSNARKGVSERSISIEQARQRKQIEEEERSRRQNAGAREKLRLLEAKNHPTPTQTHETVVRDQAGPCSPVSPSGSDGPVRRIMRRNDSGSMGDDDGSSVKSVDSVGKEEKKVVLGGKSQGNKIQELRNTSSGDLQDEGKSPPLKKNEKEKTGHYAKEKVEQKTSVIKDVNKTSVEKMKDTRDVPYVESPIQNRDDARDRRDIKKHLEDQEKKPERKTSEGKPNSEEAFGRKSQPDSEEFRSRNEYESRKDNLEKRVTRLGSKSDRGSSESLRSRDSTDKRNDDRRRPEDIKRKREDSERNERFVEPGSHASSRGRPYSGRGRVSVGGRNNLRGHPRSYSHGRAERTTAPRRSHTRNESKDYADDDMKTVAAEEKGEVNEKTEDNRFDEDRRKPSDERRTPDDDRRKPDVNKRQTESAKRLSESDRRQRDGRQRSATERTHREGDKRGTERNKHEPDEGKQPTGERRRNVNSESRFYESGKRNEKSTRDSKDDRQFKSSGRISSTRGQTTRIPSDRAERYRDKSRNKGGFGVPPPKEKPKKSDSEDKSNKETPDVVKTKQSLSLADSKTSDEKETGSLNRVKASESTFGTSKGKIEDWDLETRDTVKVAESQAITTPMQKVQAEIKTEKAVEQKDSSRDKKPAEKVNLEKRKSSVIIAKTQQENRESGATVTVPTNTSQNESKTAERRERAMKDSREQPNKSRNVSRSDPGETKVDRRRESETYAENRPRQDSKNDDKCHRPQSKRSDDRKPTVKSNGEKWDSETVSKSVERKSTANVQSNASERRGQRESHADTRQSERAQDRSDRRDNASFRDHKDQRPSKFDSRYRNERNRTDQRERTERRTEQHERSDRRDRTDQGELPERRAQRKGFGDRDRADITDKTRSGDNKNAGSNVQDSDGKLDLQNKDKHQNESLTGKDGTVKESQRTEKQGEDSSLVKKQFTVGTVSPGVDRRRYKDTRRGGFSSRRGSRGGLHGIRGRGRGRGFALDTGRPVRKGSTASKEENENDSDDFHSAPDDFHSSDSYDSDSEEVIDKHGDRWKDDKRPTRPYPQTSRSRGTYSSRGRGRGTSQLTRSPRRQTEKPPRFQRQEARGDRGRGKTSRTGFSSKENWDDNVSTSKEGGRNSDEGPLPKKRSTNSAYLNEKDSDVSYKGRRATRGGHSGNKNSFLAKKQQEVVEGSSRKGGGRYGAKSTIPAALTTHGRRAKNEPASVEGDESLEPPKKNPRRTEPQKVGIEHIDMSNIASFIDIDDIAQPASQLEPMSPQSGFVEVKSKRMQKEMKEKAREEEERKKRETEKIVQDASGKSKTTKTSSQNKQHSASRPPRFARNAGVPSNVSSTLPEGSTPPSGGTPVASPENSSTTTLPSANVEQKRASPLMLEKPSSPPPPPLFNAWTKPLSITPAKPPNEPSAELSRNSQPDPLAVGSGKPQRASGTQSRTEPGLQIQLTLPDTFQRDIDSQNSDSRIFSQVDETDDNESNVDDTLKKANNGNIPEQTESKKQDRVESTRSNVQKVEHKVNSQNGKRESSIADKNPEGEKHQQTGGNWKSTRAPRLGKNVPGKRNNDGKKLKGDNKDMNAEQKAQSDVNKTKEKNDQRPRSTSRSRDLNKSQKAKPQVKNAKSQTTDENPNIERNSQDKNGNEEKQLTVNKRDSVELDVQSMSDSILDETALGVHMVETSKSGSGNASMVKMKSEDDMKLDFEMHEKMVAAKKAWDHSSCIPSSAPMPNTAKWKATVPDNENTGSTEVSVVDQISRPSPEPAESPEPLVTTPRLKKSTSGEQHNVCKVKPQQQQQPVKPQPVASDVPEEYPTATARSVVEGPVQPSYPVQTHQPAIFTSKAAAHGYTYSFEQQSLVPLNHQYVQTDMSSIQQRHVSPVRAQTLHAASQSPPQRAASYTQGQSVSTPSPLSHQPSIQDSYRTVMPATLYSANTYAGSPFFPIPVVRTAAPAQFSANINEDIGNSVYTVQTQKSQTPSHGYETAVPATQQVFLPLEQQPYSDYVQSQRQHPVGFYSDSTNQANAGMPAHVPKSMAFPPSDKPGQPQRESRTPSGRQEHEFASPEQSELSKHVNAKPFQPPTSSPSGSAANQMPPNARPAPTMSGQSNVAYHVNNAVLSMQPSGSTALQCSVSSSDHTGTSPIVTQAQAHALPVSRLGFQYAMSSFNRQVQLPVQSLTPPTYPGGLAYRASVASYPTTTSVANQTGVLVHKPTQVIRQLVTAGRGAPVSHRVPEPIQRPSKTGFHTNTVKEKQLGPQPRLKNVHQIPSRRAFNTIGAAQAPIAAYQFQPVPISQQATQPQQQQSFRSQQHQQMLSGTQQFFAEDKEMERKQKQVTQKREVVVTTSSNPPPNNQENKSKDEQQKKRRQQVQDRKTVRTAQIPPRQTRPPSRPKPSNQKSEPIQQLSGVASTKSDTVDVS